MTQELKLTDLKVCRECILQDTPGPELVTLKTQLNLLPNYGSKTLSIDQHNSDVSWFFFPQREKKSFLREFLKEQSVMICAEKQASDTILFLFLKMKLKPLLN